MNTTLTAGSTVRQASGRSGLALRRDDAGRWVIRWLDTGTAMAYTEADIAKRFQVGSATQSTSTASQAPSRAYARRSRCPNPQDCGDPSCSGDCGY